MEEGDKVILVQPVISGTIIDVRYNKKERALEHCVRWDNSEGETHSRWFLEKELKLEVDNV